MSDSISFTVLHSKISATLTVTSNFSDSSEHSFMQPIEDSPAINRSVVIPILSVPITSLAILSICSCVSFSAGTISSAAISIVGSAFLSIFPFAVIGIASSCIYACGTMYAVRYFEMCSRSEAISTCSSAVKYAAR